jgi:ribosomal protein L13
MAFTQACTSICVLRQLQLYRWHTGYPGGLKQRTPQQMFARKPEEVLRRAVMGMLPKNRLRRGMITQLKIYEGPSHPHADELRGKQSLLPEDTVPVQPLY